MTGVAALTGQYGARLVSLAVGNRHTNAYSSIAIRSAGLGLRTRPRSSRMRSIVILAVEV